MMGFRSAACLVFLSVGCAAPRAGNAAPQVSGPPAPPSEQIDRSLSFKLPLEQPRFHWRFLEKDAFLAGSLMLRIIHDGAVESIVVFQDGTIAEGWEPMAGMPRSEGNMAGRGRPYVSGVNEDIYFGFTSSTRYATAPGDSLEIELVVVEPLAGIGRYRQGTLPAGRYLSTGSFSGFIFANWEALSDAAAQGHSMAFMECWRQPWSLTITAEEGWMTMPAAQRAARILLASQLPDEMGLDGRSCAG